MRAIQFGESANDLTRKWDGGYRYGFPDFYAAGFPVREMNFDKSRVYSGVIGRKYPDARTARYHYLFDPNMYRQPGLSDATTDTQEATARKIIFGSLIGLAALTVGVGFAARRLSRSAKRENRGR